MELTMLQSVPYLFIHQDKRVYIITTLQPHVCGATRGPCERTT
jgi:hypothetical protein